MQTIVELLRESVLTQAIITIIVLVTIAVLLVMKIAVPDQLWGFGSLIIGVYIGGKIGVAQGRATTPKQ